MEQKTRSQLVEEARKAVRAMFELRRRGASGALVARANGFADGFMRGLRDAHLCTEGELLELVRSERVRMDGPALRIERASSTETAPSSQAPRADVIPEPAFGLNAALSASQAIAAPISQLAG